MNTAEPVIIAIFTAPVDPLGVKGRAREDMPRNVSASKRVGGRVFCLKFNSGEKFTKLEIKSENMSLAMAFVGYDNEGKAFFVTAGTTNRKIPLPPALSFLYEAKATRTTEEFPIGWVHQILEGFEALT